MPRNLYEASHMPLVHDSSEDKMPAPDLDPNLLREMLRVERQTHAEVYDLARRLAEKAQRVSGLLYFKSFDRVSITNTVRLNGAVNELRAVLAEARVAGLVTQDGAG